MLAVRALPIRISFHEKRGKRKLGLVELRGTGSAGKRALNKRKQYSYGIGKIIADGNPFCFKGITGGKLCFFLIDTSSDVSILSRKLACFSKGRLPLGNYFPKYPTGEEVVVQFKVSAGIVINFFGNFLY